MTNYRFTKGNETSRIILKQQRVVVTPANLTDELAQIILNMPAFSHNIEIIPGREGVISEKKRADQTGEIELPESIRLALKEAKIDENALNTQLKKKESNSNTSMPLMVKSTKRGRPKK